MIQRITKAYAVGASITLAAALTACQGAGSTSGTPTASATSSGSSKLTVGLVMLQSDEYFNGIKSGLDAAAKAAGDTVVSAVSNNDAGTESQAVQNMIQRKIDVLLIQPVSGTGSIATIKLAKNAGIPVICYGNCTGPAADPANVDGVVQSDNTALGTATGQKAADYIKTKLGGKANIGILNCDAAAETCKLRKAGFKKALTDAGVGATYVSDQEGYLADKATPVATNMLTANPGINLLWAANEGGTVGLVTASKQLSHPVAVFGTDISKQLAGFLTASPQVLQATTGQDPAKTISTALQMATNSKNGQKNQPFQVLVPGVTYTSANAHSYLGK